MRVEKIRVEDFGFAYQDGSVALEGINLTVIKNEILGIMGPARSGKSTLLRSINRMTDAVLGTVFTRRCRWPLGPLDLVADPRHVDLA